MLFTMLSICCFPQSSTPLRPSNASGKKSLTLLKFPICFVSSKARTAASSNEIRIDRGQREVSVYGGRGSASIRRVAGCRGDPWRDWSRDGPTRRTGEMGRHRTAWSDDQVLQRRRCREGHYGRASEARSDLQSCGAGCANVESALAAATAQYWRVDRGDSFGVAERGYWTRRFDVFSSRLIAAKREAHASRAFKAGAGRHWIRAGDRSRDRASGPGPDDRRPRQGLRSDRGDGRHGWND